MTFSGGWLVWSRGQSHLEGQETSFLVMLESDPLKDPEMAKALQSGLLVARVACRGLSCNHPSN